MNVCGSTIIAIILGWISGLALGNRVLSIQDIPDSHTNWQILDQIINWQILDQILKLGSALLIVALFVSLCFVTIQTYEMGIFAIRLKAKELAKDSKKLRDELPKEYFKSYS